jgi:hypothetical protein
MNIFYPLVAKICFVTLLSLLSSASTYAMNGYNERTFWSSKEDKELKKLVPRYTNNDRTRWKDLAQKMQRKIPGFTRTDRACRERYINHVAPDISKEPLDPYEIQLIIKFHDRLGNQWTPIAKKLGRPPAQINRHCKNAQVPEKKRKASHVEKPEKKSVQKKRKSHEDLSSDLEDSEIPAHTRTIIPRSAKKSANKILERMLEKKEIESSLESETEYEIFCDISLVEPQKQNPSESDPTAYSRDEEDLQKMGTKVRDPDESTGNSQFRAEDWDLNAYPPGYEE